MTTIISTFKPTEHDYLTETFRRLQRVCPLKDMDAGQYPLESVGAIYRQKAHILKDIARYVVGGLDEFAENLGYQEKISYVVAPSWRLAYYFERNEIKSYYSFDIDILVFEKITRRKNKVIASIKVAIDEYGYFFQVNPVFITPKFAPELCKDLDEYFLDYVYLSHILQYPETYKQP